MKIETRYSGEVVILELQGKLTHGLGDIALRQQILEVVDEGRKHVLIDLGQVRTIDSSGLGELIRCKVTCDREGAQVKLLNVDLKIYKLLTMTRLIGVFDMFDDEQKALESFSE